MEHHQISVKGRTFNVHQGRYDRFWRRVLRGNWEPETYQTFDRYIDQDTLVVDFGAWIGSTAFYGAQLAKLCLAFEPDRSAFKELQANLKLNKAADWADRIKIFDEGIHASGEPISINSAGEGGDSMSSALFANRPTQWTVKTRRLEDVVAEFRGDAKKVFVKMDIEGGEYELIPSLKHLMAQADFVFSIEFHHRMFFRSHKMGADENPDWRQTYDTKMQAVIDALPWDRDMMTDSGIALDADGVKGLMLGKNPADTLIIS
ncbi:FkbM family methyltransferase [uncultured Tateyamaria sp.]|uniref:FkbM family methyltransferase n=1 Tax=uncultured Tateyamaria sp. TaxID=455651 RepID=UPI002629E286|nr:FkbM family methyltransferase [uncultured Tateyamaria sp.]